MVPTQQCRAISRNTGEQCKRMVPAGFNVCHKHGAHLPSVKAAARRRLEFLAHPAVERVARFIEEEGHDPSIVLRAAQLVLDRTGYGPSMTIQQATASPFTEDELMSEFTDEEFAAIEPIVMAALARLKEKREAEEALAMTQLEEGTPEPFSPETLPASEGNPDSFDASSIPGSDDQ
jgi:hypothetical protein